MAKSAGGLAAQRLGRQRAREIAIIERASGGSQSMSSRIRPTGRAPRGQGAEYSARRTIANTMDRLNGHLQSNQAYLSQYRGQQNQSWRATNSRLRVTQLTQAINTINRIATGPGEWTFKEELVRGIAQTAAAVK